MPGSGSSSVLGALQALGLFLGTSGRQERLPCPRSVRLSVRPSVPRAERSRAPRAPSLSLSLRALVPSNKCKCTFSKGLESPIPGSGRGGGCSWLCPQPLPLVFYLYTEINNLYKIILMSTCVLSFFLTTGRAERAGGGRGVGIGIEMGVGAEGAGSGWGSGVGNWDWDWHGDRDRDQLHFPARPLHFPARPLRGAAAGGPPVPACPAPPRPLCPARPALTLDNKDGGGEQQLLGRRVGRGAAGTGRLWRPAGHGSATAGRDRHRGPSALSQEPAGAGGAGPQP